MSAAMDLLEQQEDSTLCADLSAMMYDLALCRQGLDIVCNSKRLSVIVNLSNHTHEPTRACCIRLLGLVMARGGIQGIVKAGGEEAICLIGMLAATLATQVASVGDARLEIRSLGPMPGDAGHDPSCDEMLLEDPLDAIVEATSWPVAIPPPAPASAALWHSTCVCATVTVQPVAFSGHALALLL